MGDGRGVVLEIPRNTELNIVIFLQPIRRITLLCARENTHPQFGKPIIAETSFRLDVNQGLSRIDVVGNAG